MSEILTRKITLVGLRDLMFDKYAGDNDTQLAVKDKLYYDKDGKTLVFPARNIMSFLTAENTRSCSNSYGSKKWRELAAAIRSCVLITPTQIPILDDKDTPIVFDDFGKKIVIDYSIAKIKKSASVAIPNPKERPLILMPWRLQFTLEMVQNEYFKETTLKQLFEKGGLFIGIGTYRPDYGKFEVVEWK